MVIVMPKELHMAPKVAAMDDDQYEEQVNG